MIQHVVMLSLKGDADQGELAQVMAGLGGLIGQIDGFDGFQHGPNIDAEGKSPDHPYGFICTFSDRPALDRYASDPRHQALGARLVAMCNGGGSGIVVYDISL